MGHEGVGGILDILFGKHVELVPQAYNYSLQTIPLNKSLLGSWYSDFHSAEHPVNRLDNRINFLLQMKLVQSTCFQTVNFISGPE